MHQQSEPMGSNDGSGSQKLIVIYLQMLLNDFVCVFVCLVYCICCHPLIRSLSPNWILIQIIWTRYESYTCITSLLKIIWVINWSYFKTVTFFGPGWMNIWGRFEKVPHARPLVSQLPLAILTQPNESHVEYRFCTCAVRCHASNYELLA